MRYRIGLILCGVIFYTFKDILGTELPTIERDILNKSRLLPTTALSYILISIVFRNHNFWLPNNTEMEALFVYIIGILILYVILILKAIIEFKLIS